jgi:hypothetical protein
LQNIHGGYEMSRSEANVHALLDIAAQEISSMVRRDGTWMPDTWHVLFRIMCHESRAMREIDLKGVARYTQALALIVDFMEAYPHREYRSMVDAHVEILLDEVWEILQMTNDYRTGKSYVSASREQRVLASRFGRIAYSHEEAAFLSEALTLCQENHARISGSRALIEPAEARNAVKLDLFMDSLRTEIFDGLTWHDHSFEYLFTLLEGERFAMREASAYGVRLYAEHLKMMMECMNVETERERINGLRKVIRYDLKRLRKSVRNDLPYSDYEREVLESSHAYCIACHEAIKIRLGIT